MFKTGTYKVVEDALLLLCDPQWEHTYADEYKAALIRSKKEPTQVPHRLPLGHKVKSGQKIYLEISPPRPIIREGLDDKGMMINALTVTVVVLDEKCMYTGIMLSYNDGLPSVVVNPKALRLIPNQ